MPKGRITIERDTSGRPDAIAFGGGGHMFLDSTINQDGALLGAVVYALNQLSEQQIDSLASLAEHKPTRTTDA